MMRWEYKAETMRKRQDETLAEVMNLRGKEGWEVFHMEPGAEFVVVWYKRPLVQAEG